MTVIKSVSLTEEHAAMVQNDGVSLSAVLRAALEQLHLYKTGELLETTSSLQAKIQRLTSIIQEQAEAINVLEQKK